MVETESESAASLVKGETNPRSKRRIIYRVCDPEGFGWYFLPIALTMMVTACFVPSYPVLWIVEALLLALTIPLQSIKARITAMQLLLDENGLDWTGKGFDRLVPWNKIARVHATFENSRGRNISFHDSSGESLFRIPILYRSREEIEELLSVIAVRLPAGVEIEKTVSTANTRLINLGFGSVCVWLAVQWFPVSWPEDPFMVLVTFEMVALPIFFAMKFLLRALLGRELQLSGHKVCPEYRQRLFPYARWSLANAPLPGIRSFQYRSELTPARVKRSIWNTRAFNYAVISCFAAVGTIYIWMGALAQFVLPMVIPAFGIWAWIYKRNQRTTHTSSLGRNLQDEVQVDEGGFSVWHEGRHIAVEAYEAPMLTKSKGLLSSSLSLQAPTGNLLYDSNQMYLVESMP